MKPGKLAFCAATAVFAATVAAVLLLALLA
jgi:hypothetical protein